MDRAYSVLSDAKVTISTVLKRLKKKRTAEEVSSSKAGVQPSKKSTKKDLSAPPSDEQTRLRRRTLLAADARLSATYKELVDGGVVSEDDFWAARGEARSRVVVESTAPSNELLADARAAEADGKLKYVLNAEKIEYILAMYPAVRRARQANVPPMTEQQFWVKYFQSRYYLRDKGAAVSAKKAGDLDEGGDDLFARYEQPDDNKLPTNGAVSPSVDLTKTLGERDLNDRTADEPPAEDDIPASDLDPRADLVVRKVNRHADMVVSRIEKTVAKPEMEPDSAFLDDLVDKPKPALMHLDVDDKRFESMLADSSKHATNNRNIARTQMAWTPANLDLTAALNTATARAAAAFRVLDDKSRRPPGLHAPPAEPFRSLAESKFEVAIHLLRLFFEFKHDPKKRRNLTDKLLQLKRELDSLRLEHRDSNTKDAAQNASTLQTITGQIAAVLDDHSIPS